MWKRTCDVTRNVIVSCARLPQSRTHIVKQLFSHPPNLARLTFPKGEARNIYCDINFIREILGQVQYLHCRGHMCPQSDTTEVLSLSKPDRKY